MQQDGRTFYILDDLAEFEPGVGRRFDVNGVDVAAFRIADRVYAFSGLCPHEGTPLARGYIKDDCQIVCDKHGWTFSLEDGKRDLDPSVTIKIFIALVHDGSVWVSIDV